MENKESIIKASRQLRTDVLHSAETNKYHYHSSVLILSFWEIGTYTKLFLKYEFLILEGISFQTLNYVITKNNFHVSGKYP